MRMKKLFITMTTGLLTLSFFAFNTSYLRAEKEKAFYVGMDKCSECHPEHVESYRSWKYSKNFRVLQMRKKDHDPNCLPCHTTGFGKTGGFVNVEKTGTSKDIEHSKEYLYKLS
jgi:hypothetical protein